jgi:hypothetical protein
MAKLSWGIDANIGTRTWNGPEVTDLNMDRFLDWVWEAYPQWVDPDDESQGLKPKNNANLAASFDDFAQTQWQGVKDNVKNWERNVAAQAAKDAVTDIEV